MFTFGFGSGDLVELKDGRKGLILRNKIGTTTFVIELLDEDGKRSGNHVTEDRNNFKKCNK